MESFEDLWGLVMEECKSHVSELIFKVWFECLEPISFDEKQVVLGTPEFKKKIIEAKYYDQLCQAFEKVLGFKINVNIVATDIEQPEEKPDLGVDTFESFVVGSSNKFAHAAALAVAATPGGAYNPLFIYGNSGLGKTHLLSAICNEIQKNNENTNIIYTRGEDFTNELVQRIAQKNTTEFHDKYRTADVLLVDDVQFIAGKESTQEEFFHTFNALTQMGNQIVLTSDRPPREIATLEDRLRNRFEWGLLADIQPPDLETRMAIVKRKAEMLGFELPDDVTQYIAERLKTNIRQLEGAVKKMQAFVTMHGLPTNLTTAQNAIHDIMNDSQPDPVTVEKIIQAVAKTYGIDPDTLTSHKRDARTSELRQIAMYIVSELMGLSTKAIGEAFGGRDHTTVLYALKEIKGKMEKRSDLRSTIQEIIKNVRED